MKFIMPFTFFAAGSIATLIASNLTVANKVPDYRPFYADLPQESSKSVPIPVVPYTQNQTTLENATPKDIPQETKVEPPQIAIRNQSVIRVVKTRDTVFSTKDPIWKVELVVNNKVVDSVNALIGRSYRQNANRHTSGNKSPLPVGTYSIDTAGISLPPFEEKELGKGYWIPITPLFDTGRSVLGIHQDPSWGKTNGESGTSGCIGLESVDATHKVVKWIRQYNVRSIVVES